MTVYIDSDYVCHAEPGDGRRAFEADYFEGKCRDYIEGYRFIPSGEVWARPDGTEFHGEMISPWVNWSEPDAAQRAYERALIEDMRAALELLGVSE